MDILNFCESFIQTLRCSVDFFVGYLGLVIDKPIIKIWRPEGKCMFVFHKEVSSAGSPLFSRSLRVPRVSQ